MLKVMPGWEQVAQKMVRDADHPVADQRIVRVGRVCRYSAEPFRYCQGIPKKTAAAVKGPQTRQGPQLVLRIVKLLGKV
jgi:hypothetical protein